MDNLRAAFVWSLENGETTKALELASFLQSVWLSAGPHLAKGWPGWTPRLPTTRQRTRTSP